MPVPESATAFMAGLIERARGVRRKIAFAEGTDARVIAAAERLAREGVAEPILIGPRPDKAPEGVTFVDPQHSPKTRQYADLYYERRRSRGVTITEAAQVARQPLFFADLMVAAGDAYGSVGGAVNTTAETLRAALHCIGPAKGARVVSSCFIMALHDRSFGHCGLIAFSDAAVLIEPSSLQLAEMAIATAGTFKTLAGAEPAVALLSFSTKGSGEHPQVARVLEAVKVVRERRPDLNVDGELQADAAISEVVGRSKAPGSTVAGRANVLIFPGLAAANIAYKLMERLCGAAAIGPFLQGLAQPVNDLSRGCSADDIFNVAVVTSLQEAG